MLRDRLSNLALISIENDVLEGTDISDTIRIFVSEKAHKASF